MTSYDNWKTEPDVYNDPLAHFHTCEDCLEENAYCDDYGCTARFSLCEECEYKRNHPEQFEEYEDEDIEETEAVAA